MVTAGLMCAPLPPANAAKTPKEIPKKTANEAMPSLAFPVSTMLARMPP